MSHAPFSALLLAGGRSSRMGTDKAALPFNNQPLWRHQLATLQALSPTELFLSGPKSPPLLSSGLPILEDQIPNAGPLSGIVSGLRQINTPWLLVLAIDIPYIPASLLSDLLTHAQSEKRGVVPKDDQWWQPLAAVYPKSALPLAELCLSLPDRSMQHFVRLGITQALLLSRPVLENERSFFQNLNTPADLPPR